jgi:hypothetical protein
MQCSVKASYQALPAAFFYTVREEGRRLKTMHYFTYTVLFIKPTNPDVRKHAYHYGPQLVREIVQAPSRKRAEEWGESIAKERSWRFLYIQRKDMDAKGGEKVCTSCLRT